MTRTDVEALVLQVLTAIQERTNLVPTPVDNTTCPLRDLPNFDSLLALEASVELEGELGCESEENLFFDDQTKRPLRVAEIVERLCKRLGYSESTHA